MFLTALVLLILTSVKEITCLKRSLAHVTIVLVLLILTSVKRPPLYKDHLVIDLRKETTSLYKPVLRGSDSRSNIVYPTLYHNALHFSVHSISDRANTLFDAKLESDCYNCLHVCLYIQCF